MAFLLGLRHIRCVINMRRTLWRFAAFSFEVKKLHIFQHPTLLSVTTSICHLLYLSSRLIASPSRSSFL